LTTIVDFFDGRRAEILSSQRSLAAQDPRQERNCPANSFDSLLCNFPHMRTYYTQPQICARCRSARFDSISVNGRIELPGFGYVRLKPPPPDGIVPLSRTSGGNIRAIGPDDSRRCRVHKSQSIDGIEILNFFPLCYSCVFEGRRDIRCVSSNRALGHIRKALEYLAMGNWRNLVADVVSVILLFSGIERNSFYDPRSHGAIFLRYSRFNDPFSYFEDLVHQSGHAQFSLLLQNVELFQGIAIETPLNELHFEADDRRSLFVAIHGLVTEALICDAMFRLSRISADFRRPEVLGRLAFAIRKLGADLRSFSTLVNVFSDDGKMLFASCLATYKDVIFEYRAEFEKIRLNRQKYVFSEFVFRRENSLN